MDKLVVITEKKIEVVHTKDCIKEAVIYNLNDFLSNNINVDPTQLCAITHLDLSHCGLKEIPLPKLPLTTVLNLSHNELKEVPNCIYTGLSNLKNLDLSHNKLKSFDIEPGCCLNIEILTINNNLLYNVPDWILAGRCPNLLDLNYSHNIILNLKTAHKYNLKRIEMKNCYVMDVDYPFFKKLECLEYLDLGNDLGAKNENHCKTLDDLFIQPEWDQLKVLKLNNFSLSVLPEGIFYTTTLVQLHLVNCDLTWINAEVMYLENLEILDVTCNTLCALPEELGSLGKLQIIKATSNKICSLPKLFKSQLEILDLYSNELEEFPQGVVASVKFIDLESNYFDTRQQTFYKDYVKKRDAFREKFGFRRDEGPAEESLPSVDRHTFSYSSDCSHEVRPNFVKTCPCNSTAEEEERWDYSEPKRLFNKSPDVTESDDEWTGNESPRPVTQAMYRENSYLDYESWIFGDAD